MPVEFGTFQYPDFFEFPDGKAYCKDCVDTDGKTSLEGSFKLNPASSEHEIPAIQGNLLRQCADHHDKMRTYKQDAPQHNVFSVEVGGRTLGETNPVPSDASSVNFNISDEELATQFTEKQRGLRESFWKFWGIRR